jgi:prepilin-type N-terminal cleavage/methylation domain-containing protein
VFIVYQSPSKKRPFSKAFTLIEMMVVLGILAIVSLWATPSIKRAIDDITMQKNAETFDTLYSSMRSYYLVLNEFPPDPSNGYVPQKAVWALPSTFYNHTPEADNASTWKYTFNIKPLNFGDDPTNSELVYDIDNWIGNDWIGDNKGQKYQSMFITVEEKNSSNINTSWDVFLRERYPYVLGNTSVGYPELPISFSGDETLTNRFY